MAGDADPFRTLRRRIADDRAEASARSEPNPSGAPSYLGQTYDGGAYPAIVPAVYLTRPAALDCDESEGAAPAYAVDGSASVPVLVLGPGVPPVGSRLIARRPGPLWVSGFGGAYATGPLCGACPGIVMPTTLYLTDGNAFDSTPGTYNPSTNQWEWCANVAVQGTATTARYALGCSAGFVGSLHVPSNSIFVGGSQFFAPLADDCTQADDKARAYTGSFSSDPSSFSNISPATCSPFDLSCYVFFPTPAAGFYGPGGSGLVHINE